MTASPEREAIGLPRTFWTTILEHYSVEEALLKFEDFRDHTRAAIAHEFEHPAAVLDGTPYISTIQAAQALSIGEFHLANLRDRKKLEGTPYGRRSLYSQASLEALLEPAENGRFILARAFMRWLGLS